MSTGNLIVARLLDRVLRDYPLARERLAAHSGRAIAIDIGPLAVTIRIATAGGIEPVGDGNRDGEPPAVSFEVSPALFPALARGDDAAFKQVKFSGDSELAALLADLAQHVKWDIEEDLSHAVGDVAAHRIVGATRAATAWRREAGTRLNQNVAEYLSEERRAFITAPDLENLARANEALRDDVARLEARVDQIIATA